jgi:dTDP-4-dehydrorhamnose reductase
MQDNEAQLNRSFLVTGVSGLLGLNLAKQLTLRGATVYGFSSCKQVRLDKLSYFSCDVRDAERLTGRIRELRPEVIVHCAAATNVDWCETNPAEAFAINAWPAVDLAMAANQVGAILVLVSTDSVFDGEKGSYAENDEPRPVNAYARSKLMAEELVSTRAAEWIVVRANLYGWNGQPKNSLAEWIIQELQAGREITGFKDVIFAPLLATDLTELLIKLALCDRQGLYHAGARNAVSKYEFACLLADIYGLEKTLIRSGMLAESKLTAPRPLNTSLISTKVETELGIRLPSIEEGLKRFYGQGMSGWSQDIKKHIL